MDKYIVYKATGGLFHNLSGLTKAINIAIEKNNILIIDMDSHAAFGGNFSDYFNLECEKIVYHTNFDNMPKNILNERKNLTRGAATNGYNGKNNNYNYDIKNNINVFFGSSNPTSVIKNCISRYIKVNESTIDSIKPKLLSHKNNYIAVHFRNTDMKHDINLYLSKINNAFIEHHHIDTLYVATDDATFYDTLKSQFPNKNIIRSTIPKSGVKCLHYGCKDKVIQQHNCLIDVYNILLSDVFIPSTGSGFSRAICYMIKEGFTIFPNTISNSVIMN